MTAPTRPCPVCDDKNAQFFFKKDGHDFLKCPTCQLSFIHPVPAFEQLAPIYNQQGAPEQGLRYPYNKVDDRRKRAFVRALRLRKYFKDRDAIDFGCGGGYMVDAMQKQGARHAVGLDLDPEAIAFAQKNHDPRAEYFCETIDQFLTRGRLFDFGHSSQVIEHVGTFNDFVAGWAKLLKPGSHFFLKTPDHRHWLKGEHPETWPSAPAYTQFFNRKSIRLLLEKHGFEVEKMFFNLKPAIEIVARRK
jgi:2-polyprenyl-3-methyl-5-hydroxy-6-metoxy-1,4-benzoquinol methylase